MPIITSQNITCFLRFTSDDAGNSTPTFYNMSASNNNIFRYKKTASSATASFFSCLIFRSKFITFITLEARISFVKKEKLFADNFYRRIQILRIFIYGSSAILGFNRASSTPIASLPLLTTSVPNYRKFYRRTPPSHQDTPRSQTRKSIPVALSARHEPSSKKK